LKRGKVGTLKTWEGGKVENVGRWEGGKVENVGLGKVGTWDLGLGEVGRLGGWEVGTWELWNVSDLHPFYFRTCIPLTAGLCD
jgi:hypothetical protein